MAPVLSQPSEVELRVREQLRSLLHRLVERHEMNEAQLAEKLGIFPSAAHSLMCDDVWPLEAYIRAAAALGGEVSLTPVGDA